MTETKDNKITVTTSDKYNKKLANNNNTKHNTQKNIKQSTNKITNQHIASVPRSPITFVSNDKSVSKSKSKSKINVDSIFSASSCGTADCTSSQQEIDLMENSIDLSSNSQSPSAITKSNVCPSNLVQTDPEAMWDASFGLPLMNKEDKKKFVSKMQKNHKDFQKSLGQFTQYQTDNRTLIKTDITIDPFKPQHQSKSLKGRTVKDIYDQQVAGPKAKPKRIKSRTATTVIYENEAEMNGGKIKGTNLCGFDGTNDGFKSAEFGNEF